MRKRDLLVLALMLAIAGCGPGVEPAPAPVKPEVPPSPAPGVEGATREAVLRLGASLDLSSPDNRRGRSYIAGITAAFTEANQQGGIEGQRLELLALDDGGRPAIAAANVRRLLDQEQALLLTGVGPLCDTVVQSIAQQEYGVMVFAPLASGIEVASTSRIGGVFHLRANIETEVAFAVRCLVEQAEVDPQRIAFVTQRDGLGEAAFVAGVKALQVHGVRRDSVVHLRASHHSTNIDLHPEELVASPRAPRAYVIAASTPVSAGFLLTARAIGLKAIFICTSGVLAREIENELGVAGDRVVVLSTVAPTMGREVAERLPAELKMDSASREGWLAGRVLVAALRRCGANPSRVQVADALREVLVDGPAAVPELGAWHGKDGARTVWPLVLEGGMPRLLDPKEMGGWEVIR